MNIQLKKKLFFLNLKNIFLKNKIKYFLFYRTLLYGAKVGVFNNDKIDHIVISADKNNIIAIQNILLKNKFVIIKDEKNKLRIKKKNFVVEIIFISKSQIFFYFKNIRVSTKYFLKANETKIFNSKYSIPLKNDILINKIFSPSKINLIKYVFFNNSTNIVEKIFEILKIIFLISKYNSKISNYSLKSKLDVNSEKPFFEFLKNKFNTKKKIKMMTEKEFKNTNFDFDQSNWIFRKSHLSLFTKNTKIRKIGDIIKFIKNNYKKINLNINEVNTNKLFYEPLEWNDNLWKKGNNMFIYSIIYEYKHNVVAYKESNDYIKRNNFYKLFTKKYFENLKNMDEIEIKKFLSKNPLRIIDNSFAEGRHKVAAMIGRIVKGKKYIPICVYY